MRMRNARVQKMDMREAKFDRRGGSTTRCCEFAPKNSIGTLKQPLRARWILEDGKLRMEWTCESDKDTVPLANALLINAPFMSDWAEYRAARLRWGPAIRHRVKSVRRCAA